MEGEQGLRVWHNDRMSKTYGTLGSGKRERGEGRVGGRFLRM